MIARHPAAMSDALLASVVDGYRHGKWSGDPVRLHRMTAGLWNEAAATIPGWPKVTLTVPGSRARPKHLPLGAFPPSFVDDLEFYAYRCVVEFEPRQLKHCSP